MPTPLKHLVILLALISGACGGGAYGRAQEADTLDGWRAFLASGKADPEEAAHARGRVDALSFEEAKRAGTVAAYGRYLELHPQGAHRAAATAALERMRFEAAMAAEGSWALEDFLHKHPRGARADEARRVVAERSRAEALAGESVEALERWLRRHPGADGESEVRRALSELRFAEARQAQTLEALERYRRAFPGRHTEEVAHRERLLVVRAAALAGDEARVTAMLESTGDPGRRAALEAVAGEARVERAVVSLDPERLAALRRLPGTAGPRATAVHAALRAHPQRDALSAAARTLLDPETGLPPSVLQGSLDSQDPRRRRVAVRALGHAQSPAAVAPLVRALSDRDLWVAWNAAGALRQLGASLHPTVRDEVFTRALRELESQSASPERLAVAALVREAAGRADALELLRLAAAGGEAPLASLRLAELGGDPRRRWVALNAVAVALRDAVKARLAGLEQMRDGGPVDATLLRLLRSHEAVLARALLLGAQIAGLRSAGGDLEAMPWAAEVEVLLGRLRTLLADAEARAAAAGGWVPFDVDEGEERRAAAVVAKLEAIDTLRPHRTTPGVVDTLREATRSAHATVREAARAALGDGS